MSSTAPSPDNDYLIPIGQYATREFLQAIFSSMGERLRALELTEADYQAAIDQITTQALAIVSANITEEVDAQRLVLAEIRDNADAIVAEYEAIQANGVPATSVSLGPITGFVPTNVQAAVEAIVAALSGKASETATTMRFVAAEGRLDALETGTSPSRLYAINRHFGI